MSNELTQNSPQGVCPKCSAPLKSEIYFCSNCTEAWRNPSQGLETTPEPVWDAETRIRLRANGAYEACFIYLFASFLDS
jgi:predicted amidophosphoribosyltransferase